MSQSDSTAVPSAFCPHCGEHLEPTHRHSHLRSLGSELMEMGLHFDHRNFRSLPLLFVPGKLPRLWNSEWRARYTPPFKIYVFVALVFFGFMFATQSHDKAQSEKAAVSMEVQLDDEASTAEEPLNRTEGSLFDKEYWETVTKKLLSKERKIDHQTLVHRTEKLIFVGLILAFPLVSLWLLILYRRKALGFWQHMAFVLYTQTSIMALASIRSGLLLLPEERLHLGDNWAFMVYGIFLAIALKRFYEDSWRKTLLKLGPLVFGYTVAVGTMAGFGFCAALLWSLIQS